MELRASERELYEGRPSWRALMSFYVLGIGVAVLVLGDPRAAGGFVEARRSASLPPSRR